jgi:hypothetical protein
MCPNEKRGEHRVFLLRDINLCDITTLDSIRNEIFSQFGTKFVDQSDFDLGYFDGSKRIWIRTNKDLKELIGSDRIKSVTLWCTGRSKNMHKKERLPCLARLILKEMRYRAHLHIVCTSWS